MREQRIVVNISSLKCETINIKNKLVGAIGKVKSIYVLWINFPKMLSKYRGFGGEHFFLIIWLSHKTTHFYFIAEFNLTNITNYNV